MRAMISQCYYALTCYHLFKVPKESFTNQSTGKEIEKYVQNIEDNLINKEYFDQMLEIVGHNIYLQKIEAAILDKFLRHLRLYNKRGRKNTKDIKDSS